MSVPLPVLYFDNPMGRIFAHPDGYALLRYQAGHRTLADVHDFLVHTGRLLQHRRWLKFLSDQRQLTPFTEAERALILDYWQARHFTLGPTVGAVLAALDTAAHRSFVRVWDEAHGALRYRLFENEAEAAAWLVAQP
ncbi:hypothetical protein [Hymenobacter sp. YC55]|uniref:hypothetical protein n=1 Tax=Hymenobacter sp. YC55 TaxID=3034019 RepID=UPI0023F900C9|nr:hypothetical protein [Hymenobacter sp. YC55]MDF7815189.1 hypothetical protein [Hymenobacter sp. YC55]